MSASRDNCTMLNFKPLHFLSISFQIKVAIKCVSIWGRKIVNSSDRKWTGGSVIEFAGALKLVCTVNCNWQASSTLSLPILLKHFGCNEYPASPHKYPLQTGPVTANQKLQKNFLTLLSMISVFRIEFGKSRWFCLWNNDHNCVLGCGGSMDRWGGLGAVAGKVLRHCL